MTFPSNIKNKGTRENMLTSEQVAKICNVHASTIYRLMEKGKFPQSTKIGHQHRWHSYIIDEFLAKGGTDAIDGDC